ncbi:MAG: hypothetical protein VXV91_07920 [Verrucomicrobiota bacterium]|nr:hypothetical protein [Verrucomicrobiota bacterium]MEC7235862.1 hypothetical protein [Verrucomicrobiota bacterium]MEC8332615.1 hypothetical protein [Verrucomicrobiota bacterium]
MRKIKALIYILLGSMVVWGYLQRGNEKMAALVSIFSVLSIALTLSPIGRMRISWNDIGITLRVFPKKPKNILWTDLEKITLDHLGYHIIARTGRFKIRKVIMPNKLLLKIKESIKKNQIVSD